MLLLTTANLSIGRPVPLIESNQVAEALKFLHYSERANRRELREYIGVDPLRIEWCAAFVNAVLRQTGISGSEDVSRNPLLAKSFLNWGTEVITPKIGDVVIYQRGKQPWAGHVGFFLGTVVERGRVYYQILSGNQNNQVSVQSYPAGRELSIRRIHPKDNK